MNNDLISRREAIEVVRSMTIMLGGKQIFHPEAKKSVLCALDELSAVDAEPVRHGLNNLNEKELVYLRHLLFGRMYEIRRGKGQKATPEEKERIDKLWELLSDAITDTATKELRKIKEGTAKAGE